MEQTRYETATFGAGCFWGVEAAYRQIQGVKSTRVGYGGGHTEQPTYREVCSGNTNHAELVEVTFDPEKVSYEELLDVFWANHDPTQVNRQGPDIGTQYRTVVFFHSPGQEKSAIASRDALQERLDRPIATQIVAAQPFWEAEDYHQQYLEKRGLSTCKI
jgi:peptide-methionine (S)-S-oxide reductase